MSGEQGPSEKMDETAKKANIAVAFANMKDSMGDKKGKKPKKKVQIAEEEFVDKDEKIQHLEDQIKALESQLGDQDPKKWQATLDEKEKTINELDDELNVMDKTIRKLEKREKKLLAELEELQSNQGSTDGKEGTNTGNVPALQDEIERLKLEIQAKNEEIAQLKEKIAELEKDVEDILNENDELRVENKQLKKKLKNSGAAQNMESDAKLEEKSKILAEKDEEIENLKSQIGNLEKVQEKDDEKIAIDQEKEAKIAEERTRREELLKEEKQKVEDELNSLKIEIDQLTKSGVQADKKLTDLNLGLSQELEEAKHKIEMMQHDWKTKSGHDSAIKESWEKERFVLNELIKEQREDIERLSNKCQRLQTEIDVKESEMQAWEQRQNQLKADNIKLQEKLAEARNDKQVLRETNFALQTDLSSNRSFRESELDMSRMKRELDEREEWLKHKQTQLELKEQNEKLNTEINAKYYSREMEMEREIQKLQSELNIAKAAQNQAFNERDQIRSNLDAILEENATLNSRVDQLSKQVTFTQTNDSKLQDCESQKRAFVIDIERLTNETSRLKNDNDCLRTKLADLNNKMLTKERDHSVYVSSSTKREVEFNALYYELESLRSENRTLKRVLTESKDEGDALRGRIKHLLERPPTLENVKFEPPKVSPPIMNFSKITKPDKIAAEESFCPNPVPSHPEYSMDRSKYDRLYDEMLAMQNELKDKEKAYRNKYFNSPKV